MPDIVHWVRGGELLFTTGSGLHKDTNDLLAFVRGIAEKNLAGLVVNVGPYISAIPDSVIRLANELKFPVFELPWEVKLVEVNQAVSRYLVTRELEERSVNDLLENILFNPDCDFPMVIRRAAYYGYDLSRPHRIGIICAGDSESLLPEHHDEIALINLRERVERTVREAFNRHNPKALLMARMDNIIFLVPEKVDKNYEENKDVVQEIISHCKVKLPNLDLKAGIGSCFDNLVYAKNSFDQAQLALKFANFIQKKAGIYYYHKLGVNKLLMELEGPKLKTYYQETMGELAGYDKKHGTELIKTLAVYLQENGNAIKSAKKLFIHKNTLTYRIKCIQEITGRDLDSMYNRVALYIGLLIGKQWEPFQN
jgi:Sugar diacid utilization regulator